MFRYVYSQLLLGCLNIDLFLVLYLLINILVLQAKIYFITLGKNENDTL